MKTNQKPLISYVVTTYNIEAFVEESVKCAFAQTYSPLEIVLSDDCSTDKTFEIMQKMASEYQGPHKIVLNRNEQNLGITRHMNTAYLKLATGEIIIAAHGDDISLPERTEKSWEFLKDNPEFTACSFSIKAINENGEFLSEHSSIVNQLHTYEFNTTSIANIPAPSRAFYKKVMTQFGPLNDDCPTEDELISFRSLLLGKNAFLPDVMVKYRKHSKSSSNPENFTRFPLEKILKQQNDDMQKAVLMGIITENQKTELYGRLEKNMYIRKKYRNYFANRTLKSLVILLTHNGLSLRRRLSYIKEHLLYLRNK